MNAGAAVVHSPGYHCDIGPHVFPMEKFGMLRERLVAGGDIEESDLLDPAPATREELLLVHDPGYLDDLERLRWTPRTMMSELPLARDIVDAYVLAAGGTTRAAREALARGAAVNLGGGFHHAGPDRAEGFCYINDLAVAIRVLQREGRVCRAAVVDLDVHQGNGTARIFRDDDSVFTLSLHQQANYPVPKEPGDLDVGLADGTGDAAYLERLDEALGHVWAFAPDLVLYQAGADPYFDDRLGGLALTMDGLEARDRRVLEGCVARGIPVAVTLGGGYAHEVTDTVAIHLATIRVALSLARRPAAEEPAR
ncbi:MAG: histone deacetylase [Candidatus Eisenbacteria bacterium]|nr:histone deacetylase [Candidatus Eisenbacteria bacterium]